MKLICKIFTVGIMVSGEEEGYPKELIRLNSQLGWCGTSTGKNFMKSLIFSIFLFQAFHF